MFSKYTEIKNNIFKKYIYYFNIFSSKIYFEK